MSFFYSSAPEEIIAAIVTGDVETAASLWADQMAQVEDYAAGQMFVPLLGVLSGAGTATVPHGIDLTEASVLLVQAFYDAGSGQSKPLAIGYVDGTNVTLSGGTAAAAYRLTLVVAVGFLSF